jgi:hypothetical protein
MNNIYIDCNSEKGRLLIEIVKKSETLINNSVTVTGFEIDTSLNPTVTVTVLRNSKMYQIPKNNKITENGKYDIEITHSDNFKSVLTGIDFAYAGLNDKVYSNIPVGYVMAGATMCFKGVDDVVISDFQIIEDTVVWAV